MSKTNIFTFISSIIKEQLKNFYKSYLNINKIDICNVSYNKGYVNFYTNDINGSVPFSKFSLELIRNMCGESILMKYGYPRNKKDIPVLYLYTDFKFFEKNIREFGIKETYKIIKDWNGQSESNKIIVVKYKLIG